MSSRPVPPVDATAFPNWLKSLDQRPSACRSCTSLIRWGRTQAGKKVPVDLEPDSKSGLYVSHFATCPNADQHRAKTKGGPR